VTRAEAARLLGVKPSATPDEIRRAWRRAALRHHPDRMSTPEEKKRAHEEFIALTQARDVLLGSRSQRGADSSWAGWDPEPEADEAEDEEEEEEEEVEDEEEEEEEEDEQQEEEEEEEGEEEEDEGDGEPDDEREREFTVGGEWPWEVGIQIILGTLAQVGEFSSKFSDLSVALAAAVAGHPNLDPADPLDLLAFWADIGPSLIRLDRLAEALIDNGLSDAARATRSLQIRAVRAKRIVPHVVFVDERHCLVPSDSRPGHWYHVDIGEVSCDCPDFTASGNVCKHVLAALFRQAEERGRAIHL
jgi:hypothetical protein